MEKKETRILLNYQELLKKPNLVLRRESSEISTERAKLEKISDKHYKRTARKLRWHLLWSGKFLLIALLSPIASIGSMPFIECIFFGLIMILLAILLEWINRKRIEYWQIQMFLPLGKKTGALLEKFEKQAKQYFEIPDNAIIIHLLSPYDSEDKKKKTTGQRGKIIYKRTPLSAFVRDGNLCLWNDADLCGFPLDAIESIIMVKRPLTYLSESLLPFPEEDVAKEYNIKSKPINQFITHHTMPCYGSMYIDYKGEHFEIRFPIFEAKEILKLVNYKKLKKEKNKSWNEKTSSSRTALMKTLYCAAKAKQWLKKDVSLPKN